MTKTLPPELLDHIIDFLLPAAPVTHSIAAHDCFAPLRTLVLVDRPWRHAATRRLLQQVYLDLESQLESFKLCLTAYRAGLPRATVSVGSLFFGDDVRPESIHSLLSEDISIGSVWMTGKSEVAISDHVKGLHLDEFSLRSPFSPFGRNLRTLSLASPATVDVIDLLDPRHMPSLRNFGMILWNAACFTDAVINGPLADKLEKLAPQLEAFVFYPSAQLLVTDLRLWGHFSSSLKYLALPGGAYKNSGKVESIWCIQLDKLPHSVFLRVLRLYDDAASWDSQDRTHDLLMLGVFLPLSCLCLSNLERVIIPEILPETQASSRHTQRVASTVRGQLEINGVPYEERNLPQSDFVDLWEDLMRW